MPSSLPRGWSKAQAGDAFTDWTVAGWRTHDVTPDGQRFLMVQERERPPITPTQMVLVQNWFEELRRRVPVN